MLVMRTELKVWVDGDERWPTVHVTESERHGWASVDEFQRSILSRRPDVARIDGGIEERRRTKVMGQVMHTIQRTTLVEKGAAL